MRVDDVFLVHVAGLSLVPAPWVPADGETFEARLRATGDRWYRMRWRGWSRVDPSRALAEALEPGPRSFDVIERMRPCPCPADTPSSRHTR